ncbi:2-iminoacetate synthase ThiH [Desulfotignum phosphitoxidans]|uniref:2-iminoacetate synthase ThiH n=1 Tax=Desulfotignum phosphitoxidans DSM 13687 TaxID=1286635 RepID=S0G856_9BACT|nr:2-iminoacetate synthase ThiH [Desulfotignum phosphitoxidans]EMS81496.1 2-iminoacetate synthase ThiH [Desulfotignum phosphitoxidans DSM 13687]
MSFLDKVIEYESFDFEGFFSSVTSQNVQQSLFRDHLTVPDLLHLLSPRARDFLEPMAQKARNVTMQYFGRTIGLYAPLYISDYCANQCTYCGFNTHTTFKRNKLTPEQIDQEAAAIANTGIRHILVLTGEAPAKTPMTYLTVTMGILKKYFSSIALEMFPMDEDDYKTLIAAGADSLTIYQEVYNREIYRQVHPGGRKADYNWRLKTPERGARAGFRAVNIGALFGLGQPKVEAFMAGLHAKYLEQKFPDVEISLSLPRMTKAEGGIAPRHMLSDIDFVQVMLAWRLFMPRLGLTISTRESAAFRDRLIHLGATRYSAGSRTDVGGYSQNLDDSTVQFEVTDDRSVDQITRMIKESGFQPVFKDWEILR